MSLTNESVAVITGAASGIGRALAVRLAREPVAGIALADVNGGGLAETVRLIADKNLPVSRHVVGVADENQVRAFVDAVVERHGRATHLINNAGVALGGTVGEVSLEDIRWLMNINFWGVVCGTKLFLPVLEKQKSAHIVNISSVFGIVAPAGNAAYSASKFAVRGFSEALRHELENTNITVSIVHPGGVRTGIADNARIGAGVEYTDEELAEKIQKFNERLAATSAERAAEIIVKGIKQRRTRILIGADAKMLSILARLFPRRYYPIVNFLSGGKLKNV